MPTAFLRKPGHSYQDPLARVWIACAEQVGFKVARTGDAFASSDGRGTLLIGSDELLDPDDNLGQMIFHELCHALIEGEDAERLQDWGLDNSSGRDTWRERACLRLQAFLAGQYGLREFFAPTTDFRVSFWSKLPADPFETEQACGGFREPSCVLARQAVRRSNLPRWRAPLHGALQSSAAIAAVTPKRLGADDSALPSLWAMAASQPVAHPLGHAPLAAYHAGKGHGCGDCAWRFQPHQTWRIFRRRSWRCRHSPELKLSGDESACVRWEARELLDCLRCGACCREAYDSVEVELDEPVRVTHPDLVLCDGKRCKLKRTEQNRCQALNGGGAPTEAYACSIYEDRPRTCREFERGGAHCLAARQKVGLSL
ncbi:YkgJ family cysteine cluster protein [Candidatus Methylospira mobilis]|uniref:YkgJ family cysteine cluster protein n=2 Tax=Candidatus Methylospira mobilis TaxID=1808979 RepID=A0A5Q0BKD8_9GAMM|nr:YkgJ family cysteine cluster protein [Candidatus Methylospira mobilis]QFY42674.1 YkgJ family cysteine cluster protein [Candidatus Methylospira mobilis]